MSKPKLKEKLYRLLEEFVTITLYLWAVLGCFTAYKSIVLAAHHIDFTDHGLVILNALALAKVMLTAKDLRLGAQFDEHPLIYPTLLKSALFALVLACFKVLEEFAKGYFRHTSFHETIARLGGEPGKAILTLTVLLFVVLIPLVAFMELQRVLGKGRLAQIFLHDLAKQVGQ